MKPLQTRRRKSRTHHLIRRKEETWNKGEKVARTSRDGGLGGEKSSASQGGFSRKRMLDLIEERDGLKKSQEKEPRRE